MICSHCRFAAHEATAAAVIARIRYYTHTDLIVWKKKNGFIACSVNTQSRRCIASRKTCIAPSSHRVYVKGPLYLTIQRKQNGLRSFHTEAIRKRDTSMRLTEKLEPYIVQWCIHTARATQRCERIIEIYKVLIFPLRSFHTENERWRSDACFSWCDEATRSTFHMHAIKPLFPHCQIYICVVKLETCPVRAITVAMDLARVVTRKCEYIIKIYSVLIFSLVALLHRSLSVWKDL